MGREGGAGIWTYARRPGGRAIKSRFERGPGEEALTLAEALVQVRSGCPATGVQPPDIAGPCEETAPTRSPVRHWETGVTLLSGLD